MHEPQPHQQPASDVPFQAQLPLPPELLYRHTDLAALAFATTSEITPLGGEASQHRAIEAVRLGTGILKPGFNLFVIGPRESRLRETVETVLRQPLQQRKSPSDWLYVNNFDAPNKPIAIAMPAGTAPSFDEAMHELIDELRVTLPAAFESEEYNTRREAIDETFHKNQAEAFAALRDKASKMGIAILRTPLGFALAPKADGSVVPPDVFATWPEETRTETHKNIESLEKDLERIVRHVPLIEKEHRDAVRRLNRETAEVSVGHLIEEVKSRFAELPAIVAHLERVRADLLKNVAVFVAKDEEAAGGILAHSPFDRYEVNVFITNGGQENNAPLFDEIHPTLSNLIGRIEHIAHQGMLITDFRMIRPGALHKANGGYLLLDARDLLSEPFSWSAIKRSLQRGMIVIEDTAKYLGLSSTVTLEPEPIPLDVKVILFGDRTLYYLLAELDPALKEHFKVLADFDDDIERSATTEMNHARLLASIVKKEGMRPMTREAVGLVIERAARLAGSARKISLLTENIRDLVAEADYLASQSANDRIDAPDVQNAIEQDNWRSARIRDRIYESIQRELAAISTTGVAVGQVNAMSVLELAGFAFGRPSRITCRVRPGTGSVVDIEREVKLGGPTHSKGVLILSGFLAGRYSLDTPLSVFASLVFEQSYSGVEGDSASAAELLCVLSALAEIPLRQDLAITGSINQHGQIQAIGGVNEKIEGFFDVCKARGLTGTQGTIIPRANVQNLMLRTDVVTACSSGRFAIYAIDTIDEGLQLMTGLQAGQRGADQLFPDDSVNAKVEARLKRFAAVRREFAKGDGDRPPRDQSQ